MLHEKKQYFDFCVKARRNKHTKRCSTGTICSFLSKYLHPSNIVFVESRISDLLAIRWDIVTVRGKKRLAIVFYHDNTEDLEILAVKRWAKVEEKGNPEQYFISDNEEDFQ